MTQHLSETDVRGIAEYARIGLTAEEVEAIKSLGSFVKIVSLGELILRTETAGTVATALCMYTLGGLGNHS